MPAITTFLDKSRRPESRIRRLRTVRRRLSAGGDAVELTAAEYEPLRVLALNAGQVMTYSTLQRPVRSRHANANPIRARLFVRNLSRKLGYEVANPDSILPEHSIGYRIPNQAACSAALPDGSRLRRRRQVENGISPASVPVRLAPRQ